MHGRSRHAIVLGCAALVAALAGMLLPARASAQTAPGERLPRPNLIANIERPLRYRPDGADFVIENGSEFFNRSLYGRNTAFRVEGGDRPEFVLYLPGRGGNLRLGLKTASASKWLHDAAHITTRYRPGELLYEIRDPLLGERNVLRLEVLASHRTDGLLMRALLSGADAVADPVRLIVAFGGVDGERGARDGDIGTEAVPISEWFQLQPRFCRDDVVAVTGSTFEVRSPVAHIAGIMPADAQVSIGDAGAWNRIDALLASAGSKPVFPVALAGFGLTRGQSAYFGLQRVPGGKAVADELLTYQEVTAARATATTVERYLPAYTAQQLPAAFTVARSQFTALREHVSVKTPDPYIDAAVGALAVAADAVWDEPQGDIMHGAIAWRARLLGWRGAYLLDALGWHERARRHLQYWAGRQNTEAIPARLPPAEEATHLARNPQALHSNGDLSNSHYDMNLVYIDALFRHLLWSGDKKLAGELWPMIERHLAWERRLFRREFGPQRQPLYEAYAAIWASDDLEYHGGGVTHASAYNWWHNVMAARVAALIGRDPAPYEREAEAIRAAMNAWLWLPEQGMFAEFRDSLGLQRAHPAAALWSFYHVLDAPELVTTRQAWQMTRYVDTQLPHLPVRGPGLERDGQHLLATSHWLPYTWSTNNVVMGENMHAALGFWQAGRADEALQLFRSALLASMYMGTAPGNVGTMNYLDVYRRESQRDFADGAGVMSRALVEGLFGVRPDALAGEVAIVPGWPVDWPRAELHTPDLDLVYAGDAAVARYEFTWRLPGMQRARMHLAATGERVQSLSINGHAFSATVSTDEIGRRWLDFEWPLESRNRIVLRWNAPQAAPSLAQIDAAAGVPAAVVATRAMPEAQIAHGAFEPVDIATQFNDRVTEIFRPGKYLSPRSPFVSLAIPTQGIGAWAGHVDAAPTIDDSGLRRIASQHGGRFTLPDGVPFLTQGAGRAMNIIFTSQWDNYPRQVQLPLSGNARRLHLLMAGSTNHMQSQFDNGEVIVEYADGSNARLALRNPVNWWPIDQDYFIDDYQFRRDEPIPPRVNLQSGTVRMPGIEEFKGSGGVIPGGAATVLDLPLDAAKELRSLRVAALANEVVIGLLAVTLER
jgi:Domain of unknown function (DUF4450)